MIQLGQLWANLIPRQRLILIAAALALSVAVLLLISLNR